MDRPVHVAEIEGRLRQFPVVAILGARQIGKTTLARQVAARRRGQSTILDLERRDVADRLRDDAWLVLEPLRGLVVLDEVQQVPDLFRVLRVLADRRPLPARFLVLGSASPAMLRQTSESLAGRIAHYDLGGISIDEVGASHAHRVWLRGGFPRSYLARSNAESVRWRDEFLRTFVERDLPQLGISIPAATIHRFWTMLAHYHGQIWNAAELARALEVSEPAVRRYRDLLVSTFVVRVVPPWYENLGKRVVKAPKVYIADTGLLHVMLGVHDRPALESHPKVGASWEGFAVDAVERALRVRPHESYFWATHQGAEIDLFVTRGQRRLGFEVKRTSNPRVTKSMRIAMQDLRLDRLDVVYAGDETYPLGERIRAVGLGRLFEDVDPLP